MSANMSREAMEAAAASAEVWPPVLAIDPGSSNTGIALRVGGEALEAVTVTRNGEDDGDHRAGVLYARAVIETCGKLLRKNRDALNAAASERKVDPGGLRRAVETLVPPTPSARVKGSRVAVPPRVLASLPGASIVLGMVVGGWPRTILVPPRGSADGGWEALDGAPPNLRGRTPPGWLPGGPDRSHQRSAWAIAGVAHALDAQQRQEASTPAPVLPGRAEQVRAVVGLVIAARTDLTDPEATVAAVRTAIEGTGTASLAGMEARLAGAAARGLGADPEEVHALVTAWLASADGRAA